MRSLAARALLVLLGLGAGLGLVETALRLAVPARPGRELRGLHEPRLDRPWLFGMRPGAEVRLRVSGAVGYRANADGFRDRRYARAKPPGTFRIVALGDSITFGYGAPEGETFPKLLEARLDAAVASPRFEVLNLGVSGYNPYTEAALFTDVGVGYAPDLVLVQFCVNDLNDPTLHFDAQTALRLDVLPDAAFPDPSRRAAAAPLSLGCQGFRVCELVEDVLRARAPADGAALLSTLGAHADPSPPELAWLGARYGEIARAAHGIGARLAVVVFPFATQLDGRAGTQLQEKLTALGRAGGWATIDLLPAFRAAGRNGDTLFLDLWHPTVAGQQVAADALAAQLGCLGLVPVPTGPDCGAAPG